MVTNFGKAGKLGLCSRGPVLALAASWLVLATVGIAIVARADAQPARSSHVTELPTGSRLVLSKSRPSLLVFVHPQCPCSVATIAELERLLAHGGDRLDVQVVVFVPEGAPDGWRDTTLVTRARAIPGVRVVFDVDGREGELFGAQTSGQTLLFSPGGEVVFRGGITASRAHEGDNAGRSAIEAIAAGRTPLMHETSVFGCAFGAPQKGSP
jgi:hypothetical protein